MVSYFSRIIVSTVGTSLLTSQIDRQQESAWFKILSEYANYQLTDTPAETVDKIQIFEGENSELITIPRLPIAIDQSQLVPHAVTMALLAKGDGVGASDVEGLPEGLIAEVDGRYILSNWGNLMWQRGKDDLLGDRLLDFPGLVYGDRFRADFKGVTAADRVVLQETLARVSYLFTTNGNSPKQLVGGGLQYSPLVSKGVDHFRVNLSLRVTCRVGDGQLVLYRFGHHDIEDDPF